MKFFISLFLSLLFITSCSDKSLIPNQKEQVDTEVVGQLIGKIVEGEITITTDQNELKTKWSKYISDNSPLSISITDLEISEEEEGTFLVGRDYQNHSTSKVRINKINDNFYGSFAGNNNCTITCSGCESTGPASSGECEPNVGTGGTAFCSDCSQGTCTKTVTCDRT